jgi:CRP-like cAMP-binding protein
MHLFTQRQGSLIGEKAFLSGAKRALSVKAEEDAELMVFARITFMKAMKKTPEMAVKFLFNIACALSKSYSENMARMHAEIEVLHENAAAAPLVPPSPDAAAVGRVRTTSVHHEVLRDSVLSVHPDDECVDDTSEGVGASTKKTQPAKLSKVARSRSESSVVGTSHAAAAEAEGAELLRRLASKWEMKARLSTRG